MRGAGSGEERTEGVSAPRAPRPAPRVFAVRHATDADLPALRALIAASVRGLSVGYYTPRQAESALVHVFGPDTQLIADGTYYVAEAAGGALVAAGGWSRRRSVYGGDPPKLGPDPLLDPAAEEIGKASGRERE